MNQKDQNQSRRSSVLLIDDAGDLREIYAKKFKQEGFDVLEAKDGLEGLNVAFDKKPDLVITGIMMPRVDGFEVINTLKKDAQMKDTPVLVFSHLGRQEDIDKALSLGADDFLIQATFSPDDVVEKVRGHLGRPKSVVSSGGEKLGGHFNLRLDQYRGDTVRLAKALGADPKFSCGSCGGSLVLDVVQDTGREGKWVTGFLKCLRCGKKVE